MSEKVSRNRKKTPREHPVMYVEALLRRQMRLPMEQSHVAILLGMHRSSVQQIEAKALAKIRKAAERDRVL